MLIELVLGLWPTLTAIFFASPLVFCIKNFEKNTLGGCSQVEDKVEHLSFYQLDTEPSLAGAL